MRASLYTCKHQKVLKYWIWSKQKKCAYAHVQKSDFNRCLGISAKQPYSDWRISIESSWWFWFKQELETNA